MDTSSFSSLKWFITVGTSPGYDLKDQKRLDEADFVSIYRQVAQEVEDETTVYISCVFHQSKIIYKTEWGCPPEGEYSITLSGSCNTTFANPDEYYEALKLMTQKLKDRLHQSTILLEVVPADTVYFRSESEGQS